MSLRPDDFLIDDSFTDTDHLFNFRPDGERRARGGEDRDYGVQPLTTFQPPDAIKLIDPSNWSACIKELEEKKALVSDIRLEMANGSLMPSLDQGSVGYCWSHSTTHCMMLLRAIRNLKYVPLSAYSIAAIIKNGRDEGGWCGLSGEFVGKTGVAPQAIWPQGNRNISQLDTSATRAIMKMYATTEDWIDLVKPAYDRILNFNQVMSLLLSGIPCALDFNWWGHSVCGMDVVEVEPGSFGIRILNSWSDKWGEKGTSVLRGTKAKPDGAIAIRDIKSGEPIT